MSRTRTQRFSTPFFASFVTLILASIALYFAVQWDTSDLETVRRAEITEGERVREILSISLSQHLADAWTALDPSIDTHFPGADGTFVFDQTGLEIDRALVTVAKSDTVEAARATVARSTESGQRSMALLAWAESCDREGLSPLAKSIRSRLVRDLMTAAMSNERRLSRAQVQVGLLAYCQLRHRNVEPMTVDPIEGSLSLHWARMFSTEELQRWVRWLALPAEHPWSIRWRQRVETRSHAMSSAPAPVDIIVNGPELVVLVSREDSGLRWTHVSKVDWQEVGQDPLGLDGSVHWHRDQPSRKIGGSIERITFRSLVKPKGLHENVRQKSTLQDAGLEGSTLGWIHVKSNTRARLEKRRRVFAGILGLFVLLGGLTLGFVVRRERQFIAERTELVEHVAHELRTPAASLALHAELLQDLRDRGGIEHESLDWVIAEARRVGFVVDDLIDLSEVDAKGLSIEAFELADVVEPVVRTFAPRSQVEEVAFECDEIPILTVRSHLSSARRILFNLIDNALQYTRQDGDDSIRIEFAVTPTHARVRVVDRGVGVAPDARPHIFRGGFRGRSDRSGTGWGLALAERLALRIGATVEYTPRDRGSVFEASFPRGSQHHES